MTLNQVAFTKENIQMNIETAKAMKAAHASYKQELEKINQDELDDIRDEMEDMMWEAKEINQNL